MNFRRYWHLRTRTVAVGTILVLLVIFVVPQFFSNHNGSPPKYDNVALPKYYVLDGMVHDLENAEKQWATRSFAGYRIDVVGSRCEQHLEVRNEKIVRVYFNTCLDHTLTVSELFKLVEQDMTTVKWINGVGCDLQAIHPSFNPIWGYPEKIEYRQERAIASILNEQYYKRYVASRNEHEPCPLLGVDSYGYRVKSFTLIFSETF